MGDLVDVFRSMVKVFDDSCVKKSRPLPEHPQDFIPVIQIRYIEDNGSTPASFPQCVVTTMQVSINEETQMITFTGWFDLDQCDERLVDFNGMDKYGLDIQIYSGNNNPLIKTLFIWESRAVDHRRLRALIEKTKTESGVDRPDQLRIPGKISRMPFQDKYLVDLTVEMVTGKRRCGYYPKSATTTIPMDLYREWLRVRVEL